MATLENTVSGERIIVHSCHVFGRGGAGVNTLLEGMDISHVHASIRWEGAQWMLFDHSKNGTWINKGQIHHASVQLHNNSVIRFGASKQSTWKLIDLSPPKTLLVPLQSGETTIELNRLYVLPDPANPVISIYLTDLGRWVCEREAGITPLNDGDIITHEQKSWQFFVAKAVDSTLGFNEYRHISVDDVKVQFQASLDEEHVEIKVSYHGKSFDLQERVHHYLLLVLARHRLKDAKQGVDVDNQGWIDLSLLTKMLGLDLTYINIQIFRARKQIAEALPDVIHLLQVVERRPGSLRFGLTSFQIMRGSDMEGEMTAGSQSAQAPS